MRWGTRNTSQGRVEEKVVTVRAEREASNTVEERPGQGEAGGGNFMAALEKGRFLAVKNWGAGE